MKIPIINENFDDFSYQMMHEINIFPLLKITRDETAQSVVTLTIDVPNNLQPLAVLLRDKAIMFPQIIKLFEAINTLIESLKSYLISTEQLCLNPAHVYYDNVHDEWLFLALPLKHTPLFMEKTLDEQQRLLLKMIICHESQPIPFTLSEFKSFIADYSVLPMVWLKKVEMHTLEATSIKQKKIALKKHSHKKIALSTHANDIHKIASTFAFPSWLQLTKRKLKNQNIEESLQLSTSQNYNHPLRESIIQPSPATLKDTIKLSKYPCFMCLKTHARYYLYYDHLYIGRGEQCHIRLLDDMISQKHASIQYIKPHYVLKDENSKNGVYVEGERLVNPYTLKNGDAVRIGNLEFVFIT